jgi:hypothetical protein
MKPQPEVAFAAFVGIDCSDTKHDICLQAANSEEREFAVVPHRPRDDCAATRELAGGEPFRPPISSACTDVAG